MAYHGYHGIDTRIVRIFNTYGPRMGLDDGRVVPNFIQQALRKEPLTIFGDGSQTRSFCFVDDLVEGIYRLLLSDEHYPVNIGNPPKSVSSNLLKRSTRSPPTRQVLSCVRRLRLGDDPQRRQPDITRARQILQWEPTVTLEQGIQRTVPYFRQKMGV